MMKRLHSFEFGFALRVVITWQNCIQIHLRRIVEWPFIEFSHLRRVFFGALMKVTDLRCWSQNRYVGDFPMYLIGHQHLKLITNKFRLQTDRLQCPNNRKMSHLYAGAKSWSQSTDETFSLKPLSYYHINRLSLGFVTSFLKMLPNFSFENDELKPNPKLEIILGSNILENGSLDSQSSCEKWNIVIFLLTKGLIMWISAEVDFECIPRSK